MKMYQKLLSVGAFTLLFGLTACDKDDDKNSGQLSKNDAKSAISSFNNNAKSDLQDLANADGLKAAQDFFSLVAEDDPFGRISSDKKKFREFLRDKGTEFRNVFVPASIKTGRTNAHDGFHFDDNKGLYEWSFAENAFIKTGQSTIIKIKFPTEGSETNNAELQLSAYEDMEFVDEFGETYYNPTLLKAALFVDNAKVASLDLDFDYDSEGFPLTADIAVMVTPYTATLSFDVTASTSSTLAFSLVNGSQTLVGANVVIKYANSTKSEESLKSLEGYVQLMNLKLQGTVDVAGANGQVVDLNSIVKLALYSDNKKIGDIVFKTENQQDVPYLKYADGTQEKLETALQPVVDEINALIESMNSNG